MPIYEYACDNCGHRFDKLQKRDDPLLTDCPQCEQAALRKLVSAAAFKLKGTGWYETDFKDKKPADKSQGQATSASSSKDKPATDSATKAADSSSSKGSTASASKASD